MKRVEMREKLESGVGVLGLGVGFGFRVGLGWMGGRDGQ